MDLTLEGNQLTLLRDIETRERFTLAPVFYRFELGPSVSYRWYNFARRSHAEALNLGL